MIACLQLLAIILAVVAYLWGRHRLRRLEHQMDLFEQWLEEVMPTMRKVEEHDRKVANHERTLRRPGVSGASRKAKGAAK